MFRSGIDCGDQGDWPLGYIREADDLGHPILALHEVLGGETVETLTAAAKLAASAPALRAALQEAVDTYGKPGGPWNVPSDPGGWLDRARKALGAKH